MNASYAMTRDGPRGHKTRTGERARKSHTLDRELLRCRLEAITHRFVADMGAWIERQTTGRLSIPSIWTKALPANTNAVPWLDELGARLRRAPPRAALTAMTIVLVAMGEHRERRGTPGSTSL